MLGELLAYLRNWFIAPDGVHKDEYTIENGSISLPFLVHGQYFRICDSTFNDGVYCYPVFDLTDEMFKGTVWALKVPPEVITLAEEIESYNEKYGSESPYTSESYGGYSYQKATGENGAALSWKSTFSARLNRWRKL